MIEDKDLIRITFYTNKKVYFSYRTSVYNLCALNPLLCKNFDDLCYDWIVHRDEFAKNEIALFTARSHYALIKSSLDEITFDISDLPETTLATRRPKEKIEVWLKRIIKTAIARHRFAIKSSKIRDDKDYEDRHSRIVVCKQLLSNPHINYFTNDLINNRTYVFSLTKNDYKLFVAYLMRKLELSAKDAYNLYKIGLQQHEMFLDLKSLNLDVAHAFMPFEDLSKYYENLFNEGYNFVISHHNKMKEAHK